MGRFNQLAFVIPAFNEEKTIGKVVSQLKELGDVFVTDDCSVDKTSDVAILAGANVIKHVQNKGYEESLRTGFSAAYKWGAMYFVTCDADGQHSFDDINRVCETLVKEDLALVIGERLRAARFSETIFGAYTWKFFRVKDPLSGLKGYSRNGYEILGVFSTFNSIGTQLALTILRRKLPYKTLSINIKPRVAGTSRFGSFLAPNLKILRALLGNLQRGVE